MSADNIIYIQRRGDKYKVWEQPASLDPIPSAVAEDYTTGLEAMASAIRLQEEAGHVEYGIKVLKPKSAT